MNALDRFLLHWINGWPPFFSFLRAFSVANDYPVFKVAMVLIVLALLFTHRARAAVLSLIAFPLADGLCNAMKHLFPMARPFQELTDVTLRVGFSPSMGTASSHAANMAAIATVMTLNLGLSLGGPWIVVAILVGVSRVYVGAHYPSQVLFGWTIGITVGLAVDRIARVILARRTKSADEPQPSE